MNQLPRNVFVTGCYRSGTTLLEKVMGTHPQVFMASQPFPVLFHKAKEDFDRARGLSDRYPFGDLFCESRYSNQDLIDFLDAHTVDRGWLNALFERLGRYHDGLWTPETLDLAGEVVPDTLFGVYRQLLAALYQRLGDGNALWIGSKEILLEELIPWFLHNDIPVVQIIRDPRDVISSVAFANRDNQTGASRPILYSCRLWRKSVALAISCSDQPLFHWLRYEDLVTDPGAALAPVFDMLDIAAVGLDRLSSAPLTDQYGQTWQGNSSFADLGSISGSPVGRFRDHLPEQVREYIEAVCLPEMLWAGYQPVNRVGFDRRVLDNFEFRFDDPHAAFPDDFDCKADELDREQRRFEMLTGSPPEPEILKHWFFSTTVYDQLRRNCGAGGADAA